MYVILSCSGLGWSRRLHCLDLSCIKHMMRSADACAQQRRGELLRVAQLTAGST